MSLFEKYHNRPHQQHFIIGFPFVVQLLWVWEMMQTLHCKVIKSLLVQLHACQLVIALISLIAAERFSRWSIYHQVGNDIAPNGHCIEGR